MSAEIVEFNGVTKLDMPAERVIAQAGNAGLESVVIIGWTESEFYFASSIAGGPEVLWLLELAKLKLMKPSMEGEASP